MRILLVALLLSFTMLLLAGSLNARADSTNLDPVSQTRSSRAASTRFLYLPILSAPHGASSCSAPALAPLVWDSRLGPGGLPHLENVRIISANPAPCTQFWRAASVLFEDSYQSGGNHNIYVKTLDENENRVWGQKLLITSVYAGLNDFPIEKSPSDYYCDCNFDYPIYGDAYNAQMYGTLPSDIVAGMILPQSQHVNYRIIFQRVINPY